MKIILALAGACVCIVSNAQQNNLVHIPGYKTSDYGAIVSYVKEGKGKPDLVLIPGLGFDASVFKDFVTRNKKSFTMYLVTLPGYGNTAAPAMPDSAHASYGSQYWTNGAIEGIRKLIEKEHLRKPILVGHFVQGAQIALRMAIDMPGLIGGVIAVGAPAKFVAIVNGAVTEYPLQITIPYIDRYTGPQWFKPMSKDTFDNGNYLPEVYSLNQQTGESLWKMSANASLPVYVRYLCEFFASDITLDADKLRCPVLVLRPLFSPEVLGKDVNNYIKPQFIDAWNRMAGANPRIIIKDMTNSAAFIWKDQPVEFDKEVTEFVKKN